MPFTVKLMRSPLAVEFEVGSIEEGLGILQDSKDKFRELLEFSAELGGAAEEPVTTAIAAAPGSQGAAGKPGRKPRASKDATTAIAPAPIPVPDAAPPSPPAAAAAPADTTLGENGIPKFLDRTAAAAAAPPPPPLLPAAPPVAPPAVTPQFILGNKIADDLQKRLDGSMATDKGAALHGWLMSYVGAITVPTATIDEVIAVLRFTADDKVAHLAAPLGIS